MKELNDNDLKLYFAYFLIFLSLPIGFYPFYCFIMPGCNYMSSGFLFSFGLVSILFVFFGLEFIMENS